MIERIARRLHVHNADVVNAIGSKELTRLICCAGVLHAENPLNVEDRWIADYSLKKGNFDITNVNPDLVEKIPEPLQMGGVYQRLISDTLSEDENFADAMIRVYNDPICQIIDNYNASAYYEPSYVVARAYRQGGF
ncbi:MAG: hypothetical protein SPL30_05155 [Succinivibrio sp.]|nr:hypothetical protein [Succinivibrio sp.]